MRVAMVRQASQRAILAARSVPVALAVLLTTMSGAAFAHVDLLPKKAVAGESYEARLIVGHGCDGAPTTALRVRVPDAFEVTRVAAPSGWQVSVRLDANSEPVPYSDPVRGEGIFEIIWSGGSLRDHDRGEFGFVGRMAELPAGTMVHFPVVQECAERRLRWIDVPTANRKPDDLKFPAPGVAISPRT